MVSTLEALKKKKAKLLKKAGMKSANLAAIQQRQAEEKKLRAEIAALEHPESARAKAQVKSTLKRFGGAFKRTSKTFLNNAERMGNEMREKARKEREAERKVELARLKAKRKAPVKRRVRKRKVVRRKKRK